MVSIVILNFNGLTNKYLPNCLHSLVNQTYPSLEIIVVDNASTDDSVAYVTEEFPHILLVKNQENVGFCRGNNIGFANVTGDYVLFANNDTVFPPNCIEKLVYAINLDAQVGMVSPKLIRPLVNDNQPPLLDSAGLLLLNNLMLRDRGFGEPDMGQYNHACFLFAPCGAAAFFRRDVLNVVSKKCGELWDEDFTAYYEDGDLAWRIHQEGWKCLYFPEAVAIHHRGGSSAANFFRKPFHFKMHTIKNRYLMLIKNASLRLIAYQSLFLLKQELLIWGYLLFNPKLFVAILIILFDKIPKALRKRRLIQPQTGRKSLLVLHQELLQL